MNTRLHVETLAYTGKHSLTRGTKKKEDFYWAKKGRTLAYTGKHSLTRGIKKKEDFYWAKKGRALAYTGN